MAQRLTRLERVRRRAEFDRIHSTGVRARGRYFTILILPNGSSTPRLGVAASRRLGGAVSRNRAKRLVRELFRRSKVAAGVDVVVIPKVELLEAGFGSVEADYHSTLRRGLTQAGIGRAHSARPAARL